ncbi:enoyl-CoA hydratase/isomerase family protein [Beijerinckia indica]|uniref:3-hydroxyisobutyryl-CoA hydrolase n=1 Tax=Beijerinckia indica subsp. indica (strain ATCC 9039 / DSM 1715 / NCIMB 8712) TaxID=395963 RepID=B2IDI2_BEII9|nr:enoyl-CoA hydratase/isomerase family protein [Beijerinckia indica]ACB95418.1 Enoyl-CoA hydratase/isomerase [Beijerinckia indica subsp. indica ATCC 9039]
MSDPVILTEQQGACGIITLNRPKALNALDTETILVFNQALDTLERESGVKTVVVRGAGGKAFCAGGDMKFIYELGKAGRHAEQLDFFRLEYQLNHRIARFPKPYVSLLEGIVMGGGAGISLHAPHRVAGENFLFAMPETAIGFIPDVGATYFLPRLPGKLGAYLAMTGARLGCGDGVAFGLATAFIPVAQHEALIAKLAAGEEAGAAIAILNAPAPEPELFKLKHFVDGCFGAPTVADVLEEIDEAGYGGLMFAMNTYDLIRTRSPLSVTIALKLAQMGQKLDLEEALRTEFRVVSHILRSADFYEGVRAVLVDKDHKPNWSYKDIEALKPADVEPYFAALPEGEADLTFAVEA